MKNYKQPDSLNQVAEFHNTFSHPIAPVPAIPNKNRAELRISLLQEELDELKAAVEQNDIVEVADALCDLQYVLSGAILEFGLADDFKQLFDEVQRSNMSKSCNSPQEAMDTQNEYLKKGVSTHIVELHGQNKWLVFRTDDNKVMKNINYSPANLKQILDDSIETDIEDNNP